MELESNRVQDNAFQLQIRSLSLRNSSPFGSGAGGGLTGGAHTGCDASSLHAYFEFVAFVNDGGFLGLSSVLAADKLPPLQIDRWFRKTVFGVKAMEEYHGRRHCDAGQRGRDQPLQSTSLSPLSSSSFTVIPSLSDGG
jgi:hypothetical protein